MSDGGPTTSGGGLSRDQLEQAVQEELLTYLQAGTINQQRTAHALTPMGTHITEWDRLQRVHFCLAEPVRRFCQDIDAELRQIKTVTDRKRTSTRGRVEGQVDWGRTIQSRAQTGFQDRTQFICATPVSEYDIPENRVLKRLLWEVDRTVETLRSISQPWRRARWSDDTLDQFQRRYRRNVHLSRMPDGPDCTVSDRDISAAHQGRHPVYRTAARWLGVLRKLRAGVYDDPDVQTILSSTLVTPATDARLLELYAMFRLVDDLRATDEGLRLRPIESGDQPVAQLADTDADRWIDIYHDQTGSLTFHESLPDGIEAQLPAKPSYFRHHVASKRAYRQVASRLSDTTPQLALYRGRPDIVVEVRNDPEGPPRSVLLVEVKHTGQQGTFRSGIEELVDYWHHGRHEERRLADPDGPTTVGVIVTNGLESRSASGPLFHVDATDAFNPAISVLRGSERQSA